MSNIWGLVTYPLSSEYECERLLHEFTSRLSRNEERRLCQTNRLDICGLSNFSFLSTETYPVSKTDSSIVAAPKRFRHFVVDRCTPRDLIVTLSEPIRIGRQRRSQVWKATALNRIPCFGEPPAWNSQKKVVMDFIPEEEMAHREAWAYSKLAHLQGCQIPHSYGFFDVSWITESSSVET
jgi:hypothetical protein